MSDGPCQMKVNEGRHREPRESGARSVQFSILGGECFDVQPTLACT